MTGTLIDTVNPFFKDEDIENFKDKSYKKTLIDKIEAETKGNRKSIEIMSNKIIKQKIIESGKNPDDYLKSREKKFSSKLDVSADTKKVDLKNDKESNNFPAVQNPNAKVINAEVKELPLGAVAGSFNSLLSAIFEDMEELTDNEKSDIGTCLNMALGDYISQHDNARKIIGTVGILGVYGGKIKKARANKRKRLNKDKVESIEKEPVITKQDEKKFKENATEFIEKKIESDI